MRIIVFALFKFAALALYLGAPSASPNSFVARIMAPPRVNPADFASEVVKLSDAGLPKEARVAFADFEQGGYFSAFAYAPASGAYGYVTNAPSIDSARLFALSMCASSGPDAADCAIHAELRPRTPYAALAHSSLGAAADLIFARDYLAAERRGGHGAFAVNAMGDLGHATGYRRAADADRLALQKCSQAEQSARGRRRASLPDGLYRSIDWTCRIVHRWGD